MCSLADHKRIAKIPKLPSNVMAFFSFMDVSCARELESRPCRRIHQTFTLEAYTPRMVCDSNTAPPPKRRNTFQVSQLLEHSSRFAFSPDHRWYSCFSIRDHTRRRLQLKRLLLRRTPIPVLPSMLCRLCFLIRKRAGYGYPVRRITFRSGIRRLRPYSGMNSLSA
jgi:hypothetical protein